MIIAATTIIYYNIILDKCGLEAYLVMPISNAPVAPGLEFQTRLNSVEKNSGGQIPITNPALKCEKT